MTWLAEDMAKVHNSTSSASCMKDNSKITRFTDMVVKSNQTEHIMSANGVTTIGMGEDVSIS